MGSRGFCGQCDQPYDDEAGVHECPAPPRTETCWHGTKGPCSNCEAEAAPPAAGSSETLTPEYDTFFQRCRDIGELQAEVIRLRKLFLSETEKSDAEIASLAERVRMVEEHAKELYEESLDAAKQYKVEIDAERKVSARLVATLFGLECESQMESGKRCEPVALCQVCRAKAAAGREKEKERG